MKRTKKINLEIDTLVLEGFDYHDHKRIGAAMKVELARLITEKGLGSAADLMGDSAQIRAPSFEVPSDRNPRAIGAEIARSVYRGMRKK
jgi:hypothetical protein